jgi:flagellar assembly factor FliW
MKICTKLFGEIEVQEDKIITFDLGIIGFNDFKKFMIIHELEKEDKNILWLQSLDEPDYAIPVVNPLSIVNEYNPIIEDEILNPLGNLNEDNMLVLVSLTVPSDITKMSINLKAPIIINAETKAAIQIIADNEAYVVKYPVYEKLKALKKDGE